MAQSFMPTNVQAFAADPDITKALRRQQLAEALLQESQVPIDPNRRAGRFVVPVSPVEGLAKMLQAGLGAWQMKKAEGELSGVEKSRRQALVAELRKGTQAEPLGGDEFDIDSQIAPPVSPYANAFDRPEVNRIDLTQRQVTAPKVNVMGSYREQQEPAELSAVEKYKLRLADQVEAGNMTREQALAQLNSIETMMLGRELDMDKPVTKKMDEELVTPRGKVLVPGRLKPVELKTEWVQKYDAQGNPIYDKNNDPVLEMRTFNPIEGTIGGQALGTKPGNTGVKVSQSVTNNPASKNVLEGAGDAAKDRIKIVNAAAQGAPRTLQTVNSIRAALDSGKVSSGPGTTFGMAIKQIGQAMGFGVDQQGLNKTREVITGLAELTLQSRSELRGQGQVTENEQKLLERARSGDINSMSIGEIRTVLDVVDRTQRYWLDENRAIVDKLRKQPGASDAIPFLEVPEPAAPSGSSSGWGVRR